MGEAARSEAEEIKAIEAAIQMGSRLIDTLVEISIEISQKYGGKSKILKNNVQVCVLLYSWLLYSKLSYSHLYL